MTIIHADDDKFVRGIVSRIVKIALPDSDFEQFGNGREIQERLSKGFYSPGVVITDHEMPELSGGRIIERYANDSAFKGRIPFILAYGGDKKIGEEAMKNGAYAFVQKPFDIPGFSSLIKKALEDSVGGFEK